MTPTLMIMIAAFVGAAALVGALALMLRSPAEQAAEQRLDVLTGASAPKSASNALRDGVLSRPLDDRLNALEQYIARLFDVQLLLEQAAAPLSVTQFAMASGGMALAGAAIAVVGGTPVVTAPIAAAIAGSLPLMWILFRRKRRMKKFAEQMPDAMELIARALRSGHSLASGFQLVGSEMAEPIASEFHRVYEEQNFGISFDEALEGMTERVPNLDLKFFATAVILQRQTGGDLAEILDKIGHLVRERFKIWGQIQALTGEGRLSGIVLLGLPPALMLAVYRLNPDYIEVLFSDPLGQKMLIGAAVLQVIGALVIRKIINIKV